MSLVGVALTASHDNPARLLALDVNVGDMLMIGAVIGDAGYTMALRFKPDIHWQSLMIALTVGAFVASVPFALVEAQAGASIIPDTMGWAVILYTVIFPSILAQIFYLRQSS